MSRLFAGAMLPVFVSLIILIMSIPASATPPAFTTEQLNVITIQRPLAQNVCGAAADGQAFVLGTSSGHLRLAPGTQANIPLGLMIAPPATPTAVHDGMALLTTKTGLIRAVPAAGGTLEWEVELPAAVNALCCGKDMLYAATAAGTVHAMLYSVGAPCWQRDLGDGIIGLLSINAAEEEAIIAVTENGMLLALAPATGETIWSLSLPAKAAAAPAVEYSSTPLATMVLYHRRRQASTDILPVGGAVKKAPARAIRVV